MRDMRVCALLLVLAAAAPLEGQATGQITGIVRNSDGQPTASATVMVRGTKLSTVTGPDGRYTLPEVPPGSYTVVAALIGYGFATTTATVESEIGRASCRERGVMAGG